MDQQESLFGIQVDNETQKNISSAGWWAKLLAILGFVFMGIMLIAMLAIGLSANFSEAFEDLIDIPASAFFAIILISGLIVIVVVGVLCYLLFRGANLTRRGLQHNDQAIFNEGLVAYKNYFIVYTVFVLLGFFVKFITLFFN